MPNFEIINLSIANLIIEPIGGNGRDRFSHPAFTRKLEKYIRYPCDYSIPEKLIELEFMDGNRGWFDFEMFFGKIICNAKFINILYPDEYKETMSICAIGYKKIKRKNYIYLIFERDLPF